MFGLFRPTCPCDPAAKEWVETQLAWLTRQFGLHILLERPIILPTPEFFPDAWDGTPKAGRKMFRRVCQYMGVDPDTVELKFFEKSQGGGRPLAGLDGMGGESGVVAGTWSPGNFPWAQGVIRLDKRNLERPGDLVGIMAHELAHQRLLGEERIAPNRFDNELLTDLTATFHGFGAFLANNPRKSTGDLSYWPGTRLYMPEYISEPMLGYALAHLAWFRDETRPTWVKHLRWAPRAVFKQGLRYLEKTAGSAFKPVRLRAGRDEDS